MHPMQLYFWLLLHVLPISTLIKHVYQNMSEILIIEYYSLFIDHAAVKVAFSTQVDMLQQENSVMSQKCISLEKGENLLI